MLREPGKRLTGGKQRSSTIIGSATEEGIQIPFVGDLRGEFTGFNGVLPLYFFLPLSIVLSIALREQYHCILPKGNSSLLSKNILFGSTFHQRDVMPVV